MIIPFFISPKGPQLVKFLGFYIVFLATYISPADGAAGNHN